MERERLKEFVTLHRFSLSLSCVQAYYTAQHTVCVCMFIKNIKSNFDSILPGGGRRGGRPEGLRGRDIGMFYAARSKAKMKERELQEVQ